MTDDDHARYYGHERQREPSPTAAYERIDLARTIDDGEWAGRTGQPRVTGVFVEPYNTAWLAAYDRGAAQRGKVPLDCERCGTFAKRCQAEDRRGVTRCGYTGKEVA